MVKAIGILAGIFTTLGALPQLVKAYRTKSVGDISVLMFLTILTGVVLWAVYGVLKSDWPIIITNGISSVLNASMIFFYNKYNS